MPTKLIAFLTLYYRTAYSRLENKCARLRGPPRQEFHSTAAGSSCASSERCNASFKKNRYSGLSFEKICLFLTMCICVWGCECECRSCRGPREGIGFPDARVTGSCELSTVSAGSGTRGARTRFSSLFFPALCACLFPIMWRILRSFTEELVKRVTVQWSRTAAAH